MIEIKWCKEPKESNFVAALSYLTLRCGHKEAEQLVKKLRKAKVEEFAAKDILRAAEMESLPANIEHVASNVKKMKNHDEVSPVLLCRIKDKPLIIADGTHRISAAWHLEEDTVVHALIAELNEE